MLISTFFHKNNAVVYSIYKLYNKKFILQRRGVMSKHVDGEYQLKIFNNQHQLVKETLIPNLTGNLALDYKRGLNSMFAGEPIPDIIIHKIWAGKNEYGKISRLDLPLINELKEFSTNLPETQITEVTIAEISLELFNKAKHYACFSNSFHANSEVFQSLEFRTPIDSDNIPTKGLLFSSILIRLASMTAKSSKKSKWIIIYISNEEVCINSIKNNESKVFYRQALERDSILTQDDFIMKVTTIVCYMCIRMSGLDGIIFSGNVGIKSAKVRQLICDKLDWIGLKSSSKANLENKAKFNKKSSMIELFNIIAEPETSMLQQLSERL
jgi:acetate kinase